MSSNAESWLRGLWTMLLLAVTAGRGVYAQHADVAPFSLEEISRQFRAGAELEAILQLDSLVQLETSQQDTAFWLTALDSLRKFGHLQAGKREELYFQATFKGDTVYTSSRTSSDTIDLNDRIGDWDIQRAVLRGARGLLLTNTFSDSTPVYQVGNSPLPNVYSALPDSLGHLSFEEVLARTDLFRLTSNTEVDSSGRWFRIRVRNPIDSARQAFIQFGSSNSEEGDWERVYVYHKAFDNKWTRHVTGWESHVPGKQFRERGCVASLHIPALYDGYSYVQVIPDEETLGKDAEFRLVDYAAYLEAEMTLRNTNGIFLGILLIQSVYFFLLFLATRDKSYISYVLFIVGLMGFTLTFGYIPLWMKDGGGIQGLIFLFSLLSCYYGLILFSYHFLAVPGKRPLSRKWLKRLLWAMPLSFILPMLLILIAALIEGEGESQSFAIAATVIGVTCGTLIFLLFLFSIFFGVILSIRALRAGYSPARFFMLSQSVFVLGIIGPVLVVIASMIIDEKPDWLSLRMVIGSLQVGAILQLSFMALGVGQKRRLLEKDKLKVEQELNQELRELNDAFSRFVPSEFLKAIGKQSVLEVSPGDGVEKEVTVLFSDIRGYTSLSERMTPAETFSFINQYLSWVAPEIRRCGGFVNQFYGDGIMALFIEDVASGLEAAICMQRGIDRFNEGRELKIRVGIGLHSGPLMMGVIGNQDRLEAGVVADTVNTAARMEGLTKYFGANLLVSESIYSGLSKPEAWQHRFVARVQVKGRQQPLAVYDFFEADTEEIRSLKAQSLEYFNQGVEAYLDRDFETAVSHLSGALKIYPEDLAAQRYLSQAQSYAVSGVPEDWTGVETMLQK